MEFNPNKPAVRKEFLWSTYIPTRRPNFKMYSQRGHALSSFQYRSSGILYKWVNDAWKEMFRLENEPPHYKCDRCGTLHPKDYYLKRKWKDEGDHVELHYICSYRKGCDAK